ncbi:MAG TPA: TonB-dependent receptor, partial [Novosphingobium sp.]
DWQVVATRYRYARDWQTNPSPDTATATSIATGFVATRADLPGAFAGGPGTIQQQSGTGWATLDASAALPLDRDHAQVLSLGAHADRETLDAATWSIADWRDPRSTLGQLRSRAVGHTRTLALWAQDALPIAPRVTLTVGGRQEWWRAWGGRNATLTATVRATLLQPERRFAGFSPKASLEWRAGGGLAVRLSAGQAWRMPTVGELYQTITVGTQLANPNPALAPERARSAELALEHRDRHGSARLALFDEVIVGALIAQLDAASGATFVQNVDWTRARGVELALDRRDLLPGLDLAASLTYADAITGKDLALPAAQGKLLPSVPRWKGNAVLTWHAVPGLALTGAVRFTSRNYANLANDDVVGQTYQGFYKYTVVDLRAQFTPAGPLTFAVGVDNLNNDRYFLFHPFPQRTFFAQLDWKM